MRMSKLFLAATALAALAATSAGTNAQGYEYGRSHGYGSSNGSNSDGYSRFTGRNPNYLPGLGLGKQTATGGPSGGSTISGGGR